jgi:hypothetical protein
MSRRLMYLVCVALLALLLGPAAQAARDVTMPGDPIVAIPNNGNWPANEQVNQAIDNQIVTKYLHFEGATSPTGLAVTPSAGATVVTKINLCTANDAPERDPMTYELSGSNDSIDGPWTLISSGNITAWATDPGRRVWLPKPITFANTVSYKHYKLMFPTCRGPSQNSMQIAEVELMADVLVATGPNPADGAVGVEMPLLQWVAGDTATFVDVYVSTSPEITAEDLFKRYPTSTPPMAYYMGKYPWTPGQKYYWRVDCIDKSNNVYTGDVWSFTAKSVSAYAPDPMDGDKWISTSTTLSWSPGQGAMKHKLYFSTDKDAVANRDASAYVDELVPPQYNPGELAENTTYYWAVDETPATAANVGAVWSFTTVGPGGGLKGEYFNNTDLSGLPVLTRIDPVIDVTAAIGAPVVDSGWSARWTADLEITQSDTYNFALNCHAYTRMWIDGKLIIDKWQVAGVGTATVVSKYFSLPVPLERGIHAVVVEYICTGTYAETLTWWTATVAEVTVPAGPLQPPVRARALYPANGDVNVPQDVMLTWSTGEKAAQHDVYFGDDAAAVEAADTSSSLYKGQQEENTFDPGPLEWNKKYYWRVDEVNDAETDSPWVSSVWSFTTADFLVVDNMETYNDEEGTGTRIYETWIDGYTDGESGSTVGNLDPPFAEHTIVHGGVQSMPLDYNNVNAPYFSHAYREFSPVQDWTVNGVTDLVVWVRGYPAPMPAVVADAAGKMTVTGEGSDIWNNSDQFTFVYKTLNGDGSLVARVTSNGTGTDTWTKGGVMIRDGLDAGSTHAMMAMTGGGGNGASFQYRVTADAASANGDATTAVAPPYYVKIERSGDTLTGSVSPDGTNWTTIGTPQYIAMMNPVYVGICVTSHVAGAQRTFEFDKVTATGASGAWQTREIGLTRNPAAPLYVTLEDSTAKKATVVNPDPAAVNVTQWTEWRIPLTEFTGVNPQKVKRLYIGVGDEANPTPDGAGRIFIDDIRVMKPVAE